MPPIEAEFNNLGVHSGSLTWIADLPQTLMLETEYNQTIHFGSLTRIADLHLEPFSIQAAPREAWNCGDYVVGRYVGSESPIVDCVELCDGSLQPLKANDLVVGAFGVREASQECVGTWKNIGAGSHPAMHHICGSGMFGIETDRSARHHAPANFVYEGHCVRNGQKVTMKDYAPTRTATEMPRCPLILLVGSSMSCGKTYAGKVLVGLSKQLGFERVAGVKFTGGGYKHDISEFSLAGADFVLDFCDAGVSSTVMPPAEFRHDVLPAMFGLLDDFKPDCVVAELGASPLEPYNGVEALRALLASHTCQRVFTVMCASDAYAAAGLRQALISEGLAFRPDIVCGIASSNSAGIALVERVSGLPALNISDPSSVDTLRELLKMRLMMD